MPTDTHSLKLQGSVALPGDEDYTVFSKTFSHQGNPQIIARCANADDVRAALDWAQKNNLAVSVRGGGHSFAGFSTNDGGMVIDLSLIHNVEVIDTAARTVRIGGGATWRQVTEALQPHGLSLSSGDTRTVGVGGLMLGGGVGWMVRKFGLAIDSLLAAEIVTADGQLLRADKNTHDDLFWAVRGGGGNFGVVIAFEVTTYPIKEVFTGDIVYPIAEIGSVLKKWRDYMRTATEDITTIARVIPPLPNMQPAVVVSYCHAGSDEAAVTRDLQPLRQLGTELKFDMRRIPYVQMITDHPTPPPGMQMQATSAFIRQANDEVIEAVAKNFGVAGSPILQLRSIGGAMNRVPANATAFGFRDCEVLLAAMMALPPNAPQTAIEDTPAWQAAQAFSAGKYSNFLSWGSPENSKQSYPADTYERLAAIKKQYDPVNIFKSCPNIIPTA